MTTIPIHIRFLMPDFHRRCFFHPNALAQQPLGVAFKGGLHAHKVHDFLRRSQQLSPSKS
jgi:hypothetical protein